MKHKCYKCKKKIKIQLSKRWICLECKRKTELEYYHLNSERRKEKMRAYYRKNKKRFIQKAKQWRTDNKKQTLLSQQKSTKKWKSRNKDAVLVSNANRRALKKSAQGSYTKEQWQDLKRKYKYRCAICKKKKPLTQDHIIPLSKGGSNFISNIQPLCKSCNCAKYNFIQSAIKVKEGERYHSKTLQNNP